MPGPSRVLAVARESRRTRHPPRGLPLFGGIGTVAAMNSDSLTRAFIRGAVLAAGLTACTDSAAPPLEAKLDPIPDRTYPYCVGPNYMDDFGYHGQCCGEIRCAEPVAGDCPDTASPSVARFLPPGSGTCGCDEGVEGPFLWTSSAPENEVGDCCYVIYSIGCDGRPLTKDGQVVVAAVVQRADWLGAATFPAWSQMPIAG